MPTCDEVPYDVNESYFAAGNVASSFFIAEKQWQTSLFHNLLLRPRIQLFDTALIADDRVANHLTDHLRHGKSWLEVGLENAWVIPRLRMGSFPELARHLPTRGFVGIGSRLNTVVERLERTEYHARPWPEGEALGVSYESMLRNELAVDAPGYYDSLGNGEVAERLLTFWKDCRPWRTEWLDRASDLAHESGEVGVRISDFTRVGYQSQEIEPPLFPSVKDLIARASKVRPEIELNLAIFFKILCEFHNRNAALRFQCLSNSLNLDWISGAVTLGRSQSTPETVELFPLATLEFPTLDEFRRTPGHVLQHLRENDSGRQYFADLESWSVAPTEAHAARLASSLQRYGRAICEAIEPTAPRGQRPILGARGKDILSLFASAGVSWICQTPAPVMMGAVNLVLAEGVEALRRLCSRRDWIEVSAEYSTVDVQIPELTGAPIKPE